MSKNEAVEDDAIDTVVETILDKAGLTDKRRAFVREYVTDWNATQAAKRAGYSEKTAQQQGSRLLTNVVIAKAVRDVKRERSKFLNTGKDDVIAFHSEVMHDPDATRKERLASAKELARINGMYDDSLSVNLDGSLAERLARARKRKTG